ncbi:hypothetical protein EUTSA_v10017608mg [Eutrema salsugineum]|uniref:Phytocyanin domain-containing protein n=1 Tax=Eutrema salsugineum TaxID=72664 RepID=V4M5Q8_EUTSA|nr:hypothetical protein EUTSA_v10017608mg [Eutrema salsugineum]
MALNQSKSFLASLLILVALFGVTVGGTVHKVGETFKVGDSLVFKYNNEFHDVTEVTPHDFELCVPSKPLAKYQTGSDTVTLTKPGIHHFICGIDILVLPASLGPVSAPVTGPVRSPSSLSSHPPVNAPQYHHQMAPSPLQSGATKLASWIGFSLLALIFAYCY